MKFLWIVGVLVAIGGGALMGRSAAEREYVVPQDVFGPFGAPGVSDEEAMIRLFKEAGTSFGAQVEVVGGDVHDFGVMHRYASATHAFELKNVGTGPLELKVVGSTCKCTVGTLENETLQPGESTLVNLEWSAKTDGSRFSQSATLKTNDPAQAEVQLRVEGDVVDLLAADPVSWNVADVAGTVPLTLESTIYNHSPAPLEITTAEWLSKDFQERSEVTWRRRAIDPLAEPMHAEASEAYELTIEVEPTLPLGPLRETFRIRYQTDDGAAEGEDPPMELTLTGRVVGPLTIMGGSRLQRLGDGLTRLDLGETTSDVPLEQKFYLILRGPRRNEIELRIPRVEPADVLEAELGEPTDRGSIRLIPLLVRTKQGAPPTVRFGQNDEDFGLVVVDSEDAEVAPLRLSVIFQVAAPE